MLSTVTASTPDSYVPASNRNMTNYGEDHSASDLSETTAKIDTILEYIANRSISHHRDSAPAYSSRTGRQIERTSRSRIRHTSLFSNL